MVWLSAKDAPKTPDDYDRFVCAEIPNKEDHPELHRLVIKFISMDHVEKTTQSLHVWKKTILTGLYRGIPCTWLANFQVTDKDLLQMEVSQVQST